MSEILSIYTKLFKRHPFFLVFSVIIYAIIFMWFFFRTEVRDIWINIREGNVYREQLLELKNELRAREQILNTLTKRSRSASFIKDIAFIEKWKSEENKTEVGRLIEYADFAVRKNDPNRAESLYQESLSIQETFSANYELASLYYSEGNLEKAIASWEKFKKLDSENNYPVVGLYLGIAYHELGEEEKSLSNLKNYVMKTLPNKANSADAKSRAAD